MTRRATSWEAWLSRRGPHVQARLRRLNPPGGPRPGHRIRGWHPRNSWERRIMRGEVPFAEAVRTYGRAAVDGCLARGMQVERGGKRRWVTRFDLADFGLLR